MEINDKKSTAEPQDLLRIDFNYAVGALPIDIVEDIIAVRPHVVSQLGKDLPSSVTLMTTH